MVTANLNYRHMQPARSETAEGNSYPAGGVERFLEEFPSDRACLDYLLRLRFGTRIKCPKCERTAKFHKIRQIPAYACQWCGYHLHPMAQTRFARSRIGLRHWFHAIHLIADPNSSRSARELQRDLGLTYKTAWRIRSTIVDAKYELRSRSPHPKTVDFDGLLAVMLTPKEVTPTKRRSGR